MKFRYFLYFSVSLELTLIGYCLYEANSFSLNDSFGEDLLHLNPCIIAIIFFFSVEYFVCYKSQLQKL